jgi:hypothetical protein
MRRNTAVSVMSDCQHGADGVAVIVQGKLRRDDTIGDAGLVTQVKQPKPVLVLES